VEIHNAFDVPATPEVAWEVLTDLERIAPCLPGAQLTGREGDRFLGSVKVKVGPITAAYRGEARFEELDPERRVAVLRAEGREQRGQGRAHAVVTATMTPQGEGTHVDVVADLQVQGRVAQFGRGVLQDVSAQLMAEFARQLAALLELPEPQPGGAGEPVVEDSHAVDASSEAAGNDRRTEAEPPTLETPVVGGETRSMPLRATPSPPPARELNVLALAWRPIARRAVGPLVGVAIVVAILVRRRGRRRRGA
jgi:carbon monoxide dehydrogenase subunit G